MGLESFIELRTWVWRNWQFA